MSPDRPYGRGPQPSRWWRGNSQRLRLEGVRYENGRVRLQAKHEPLTVTSSKLSQVRVPTTTKGR